MEFLRTEAVVFKYVIMAPRDGRLKYVGRHYNQRKDYGYTVKTNGAMEFDTQEAARNAMERFGLSGSIGKIKKLTELVEVM